MFCEGHLVAHCLIRIDMKKVILPFTTSYQAEATVGALVLIKTDNRNRIITHNDFTLAVTNIIRIQNNLSKNCKLRTASKVCYHAPLIVHRLAFINATFSSKFRN